MWLKINKNIINLHLGSCLRTGIINQQLNIWSITKKKTHPKKHNLMMIPVSESFNGLKFYISFGRKLVLFKQVVRKEIYTHGCNRWQEKIPHLLMPCKLQPIVSPRDNVFVTTTLNSNSQMTNVAKANLIIIIIKIVL